MTRHDTRGLTPALTLIPAAIKTVRKHPERAYRHYEL